MFGLSFAAFHLLSLVVIFLCIFVIIGCCIAFLYIKHDKLLDHIGDSALGIAIIFAVLDLINITIYLW